MPFKIPKREVWEAFERVKAAGFVSLDTADQALGGAVSDIVTGDEAAVGEPPQHRSLGNATV